MARRQTQPANDPDEVMPRYLVETPDREARRAWCVAHGLMTQQEQHAAREAARRVHGIPDPPDPRLLMGDSQER